MTEKTFLLVTEAHTAELAQQLASSISRLVQLHPELKLHISLIGDLGAGKTTFTRYLLKSLGHLGKVKSPTYALCEPYELNLDGQKLTVHHFDLYRMRYAEEWIDAGFRDTFTNPGMCIVEWPEKAEGTLPTVDCTLSLDMNDDETRKIKLLSHTAIGENLLKPIDLNSQS